jgi:hypothetical protein
LASSRDTRNGPDWKDITQAVINYELFNRCQIDVTLSFSKDGKHGGCLIVADAHGQRGEPPDQKHLASASVRCTNDGYLTLEAYILKCLFDLDVAMWAVDGATE